MRVLDLGGRASHWLGSEIRPAEVVCVNLEPPETAARELPWLTVKHGDACAWSERGTYDLVFSNSLIEHVGGHERRLRLAESIHRASSRFWIQTPYRYFPVEPHFLFPAFQQLPVPLRVRIAEHWPRKDAGRSFTDSYDHTSWIELLSITDMRMYFPGAELWYERFGGLVKSLVAVKA